MAHVATKKLSALVGLLGFAVTTVAAPARSQIAFEEVTTAAGITRMSVTYGLAWGDLDGDGWPDLWVGNHGTATSLYRNNRDGTFTDLVAQLDPNGSYQDWH
ncbi:MAG: VCBS repeat-containing protein, partial [Deltaproteobacteria bacterium]|nr:VCBS repeat-containing protein [Deltaproteobacteria bacterium]